MMKTSDCRYRFPRWLSKAAGLLAFVAVQAASTASLAQDAETGTVSAQEIVRKCVLEKDPGRDQSSELTVVLYDSLGQVDTKTVYRRFWKTYDRGDVAQKMALYTQYPPDQKGTAFMRWVYRPEARKEPDQWLYLPHLKSIRRVSARAEGDSFLGSDLTYRDVAYRPLQADEHKLVDQGVIGKKQRYIIESTPRQPDPLYGRTVSVFEMDGHWTNCNRTRVDYFDRQGELLKTQVVDWQKIDGIWLWREVRVKNMGTDRRSIFKITDVSVNVGLSEDLFSERRLRRGLR